MDPRDFEDIPEWQRHLILIGAAMGSSTRGLQQIANKVGLKSKTFGTSDEDMKGIDFNEKAVDDLADKTRGGVLSSLFGSLADPVGLLAGGALGKAAGIGSKLLAPTKSGARALAEATAGGAAQGLVAEERENENRFSNALMSGLMSAAAKPAGNAVNKMWGGITQRNNLPKEQRDLFDKIARNYGEKKTWSSPELVEEGKKVGMFPGYTNGVYNIFDNPWRVWIDTSDAKVMKGLVEDEPFLKAMGSKNLAKIAPELDDYKVTLLDALRGPEAALNGKEVWSKAYDDAGHLSNLRHEGTHIFQEMNDFPKGTTPEGMRKKLSGAGVRGTDSNSGLFAYFMNPGEIEARDAASRSVIGGGNAMLDAHAPYTLNVGPGNEGVLKYFQMGQPHMKVAALARTPHEKALAAFLNTPESMAKYPMFAEFMPPNYKDDLVNLRRSWNAEKLPLLQYMR